MRTWQSPSKMTSWNPSSDASYKADATAIPSTSKGEYTRLRVLDSEANIAPCASWITAPILDFCSLLNSAPSKLILTMSKIGALHWAQIGVDCGGGDGCIAWYFVRSSKAKFASWFGLHQGWLALTRFWCVHIVQTVTENNFKFYCLLIIQDSNSLKSMNVVVLYKPIMTHLPIQHPVHGMIRGREGAFQAPSYIYHIEDHRWSCVEQGSVLWAVNSSKLSITDSSFCLGFVETKPPSTLSFLMQPVLILHWEHPLPWETDIRICYYTLHCVWKAKIGCPHKSLLANANF